MSFLPTVKHTQLREIMCNFGLVMMSIYTLYIVPIQATFTAIISLGIGELPLLQRNTCTATRVTSCHSFENVRNNNKTNLNSAISAMQMVPLKLSKDTKADLSGKSPEIF